MKAIVMRKCRTAVALALLAAMPLSTLVPLVLAKEQAHAAAASACGGIDMLAELATTDPEIYATVMQAKRTSSNAEAVLWKVEGLSAQTSHLFGTIHLSDPRVSVLSDNVKATLGKSAKLAVEVADLSDSAMGAAMADAAQSLMYSDGKSLTDKLSGAEIAQVEAIVGKSGMPIESAHLLRPWLLNMLLSVSECERRQMAAGATVLDMRLVEEAQNRAIPVVGLESIAQQLASLSEMPEDQQVLMLKSGLKYADRTDDMMETLVQLYLKRQMGAAIPFQLALAAKTGVPPSAFDGFQKALLFDRNERMRDTMKPLLDKGRAFIAVGALHLSGDKGLVALLRQVGYTVTPIE